ncbi:MAG: hypothetical protein ACLRIS_01950 [Flavonifractor plautii]
MQKIGSWVLLAVAVGTVSLVLAGPGALATFSPIRSGGQTLVLDAGHGGEDERGLALRGTGERNHLAIVQKLDQLLGLYGGRRFCCA